MATTDVVGVLRRGIIKIVNADTALRTAMGRTTRLIRPWEDGQQENLPAIAFAYLGARPSGVSGNTWLVRYAFAAFAEGKTADEDVLTFVELLMQAVTEPALTAQALDAAPLRWERTPVVVDAQDSRSMAATGVNGEFLITN